MPTHNPTRRSGRPVPSSSRRPPTSRRPVARQPFLPRLLAADPPAALFPLRAFLGVTFCFAGLQKLANPQFFNSSNPASIQAQMAAAHRFSPISGLVTPLSHHAVFIGVVIALGELAVGLGVLTGIATRVAAAGGMVLAFSLWLTVSFHSRPYYTGADIVFLFAFTPLVMAGPGSLTLPALVGRLADSYRLPPALETDLGRRRVLTGGVAAFGLLAAGLAAGLGRAIGGARPSSHGVAIGGGKTGTSAPPTTAAPATTAPSSPGSTAPTTAPANTPSGTLIGPAADVPVGGAATFNDPSSGDPSVVIQPQAGHFLAFDAVCPHAGCTVQYDNSANEFVCPCHGSTFDSGTGAVLQGPAASGLRPIPITDSGNGQLYVT